MLFLLRFRFVCIWGKARRGAPRKNENRSKPSIGVRTVQSLMFFFALRRKRLRKRCVTKQKEPARKYHERKNIIQCVRIPEGSCTHPYFPNFCAPDQFQKNPTTFFAQKSLSSTSWNSEAIVSDLRSQTVFSDYSSPPLMRKKRIYYDAHILRVPLQTIIKNSKSLPLRSPPYRTSQLTAASDDDN